MCGGPPEWEVRETLHQSVSSLVSPPTAGLPGRRAADPPGGGGPREYRHPRDLRLATQHGHAALTDGTSEAAAACPAAGTLPERHARAQSHWLLQLLW